MSSSKKGSTPMRGMEGLQFEFQAPEPSENSLGNYLRSVFSNSSGSIPEVIQNHFASTAPLPSSFQTIQHRRPGTGSGSSGGSSSGQGASQYQSDSQSQPLPLPKPSDSLPAPATRDLPPSGGSPSSHSPSKGSGSMERYGGGSDMRGRASLDALGEACASPDSHRQNGHGHRAQSQPPAPPAQQSEQQAQSPQPSQQQGVQSGPSSNMMAVSQRHPQLSLVPSVQDGEQQYAEITEFLNMPQSEAAKKLGIPASTLSKRWKEAARNRKWPWRTICKVDKEITTLLHNIPPGGPIPEDIEGNLGLLLRRRQEELKPVVIRL